MPIDSHDSRERYCPRLGHELAFSYCRKPGSEPPCSRIRDCWWERFDIQAFLEDHYSAETLADMATPPANRVTSLFDLMKQAQERVRQQNSDSAADKGE